MNSAGFQVLYNPHLKKDFKNLNNNQLNAFFKIVNDILLKNPLKGKKLKGRFSGLYSFRTGSYRIIYEIDSSIKTIYILRFRHRKDIYDSLF